VGREIGRHLQSIDDDPGADDEAQRKERLQHPKQIHLGHALPPPSASTLQQVEMEIWMRQSPAEILPAATQSCPGGSPLPDPPLLARAAGIFQVPPICSLRPATPALVAQNFRHPPTTMLAEEEITEIRESFDARISILKEKPFGIFAFHFCFTHLVKKASIESRQGRGQWAVTTKTSVFESGHRACRMFASPVHFFSADSILSEFHRRLLPRAICQFLS
jgi:hypothetical protein